MGIVIGELVCQVLLSVLPTARDVCLDVLFKLWYLEMEGYVEEAGYLIVSVLLGGEHQVQLRGGREQHVIYVLEKGEMCDLLLRGHLVRLKYLHAVLDLRLREVLREEHQGGVDAVLPHLVRTVEGLGGADCQTHHRVRFPHEEVLGDVIELAVDVPQNLATLGTHEHGVSMLLECRVVCCLPQLLVEPECFLMLPH